jgi:cell division protein FtsZ
MGGGTGTGAAPVICELAREAGALTVGIVTKPFLFEGRKRMRQAEQGIAEMRKHVDTMIIVPNERLLAVVGKGIPFQDALKKADEVLLHATQGISVLISVTGLVNVDFADVRTVMQNGGSALMGTGIGRGENRAMEAAQQAIASPLLDNVSIAARRGVLVNITGGNDLTLARSPDQRDRARRGGRRRRNHLRGRHEPAMQGEIRVTVIATGFDRCREVGHGARVADSYAAAKNPAVIPFARTARPSTRSGAVRRWLTRRDGRWLPPPTVRRRSRRTWKSRRSFGDRWIDLRRQPPRRAGPGTAVRHASRRRNALRPPRPGGPERR